MLQDPEWENQTMEDSIQRRSGEVVLSSFGSFLEEYESQLSAIEEALSGTSELDFQPIHFKFEAEENTSELELIDTNNKFMNKILIVFSSLCLEVKTLSKEFKEKYLDVIVYYGEGHEINEGGENHDMFTEVVPVLYDLLGFLKRCNVVIIQILNQLSAYYQLPRNKPKLAYSAEAVPLPDVFDHLKQALMMIATLDEVLSSHVVLKDHLICYENMIIRLVHDNTSYILQKKYNLEPSKISWLIKMLREIRLTLLRGSIFMCTMNEPFKRSKELAVQLESLLKASIYDLEARVDKEAGMPEIWAEVCVTYVFYGFNFGSTDKKLFKVVWEICKKCPAVTLRGNVLWLPDQFLLQRLPHLSRTCVDKKTQASVAGARINYVHLTIYNLTKIVAVHAFQVFAFVLEMERVLKRDLTHFKVDDIKIISSLLLEGVKISQKMKFLVASLTNLHGSLGKPMTKASVEGVCRVVELLKAVRETYKRHYYVIAHNMGHILQRFYYEALLLVSSAKENMMADHKNYERNIDTLSVLVVAEKCLLGPPTAQRHLILKLALSFASQKSSFTEEALTKLSSAVSHLTRIVKVMDLLEEATCCDFLYWHRVILPIYFSSLLQSKTHLNRIKYVLEGAEDAVSSMQAFLKPNIVQPLEKDLTLELKNKIIKPLCVEIETILRLQAHSHLQAVQRHLPRVPAECMEIFTLPPIILFQCMIDLKGIVGNYLEQTFYDLTTVALHDWRTYGEMRCLAKYKYKISTVEDTLPSQTVEQGLDVLEIMRNIHIFVARYQYNLNNQIFIEKSSNNKHLLTINIRHVANSIRTHGSGIMNTTVNFTYQFVRKKLLIFSTFLYDELINSRLNQEQVYFSDNKAQLISKYPLERAEKFNRDIRRLGVFEGQTYLDQFRILVIEIGNAMGYVRMIRSGGLHCCYNATRYIPDLDNIVSLEKLSRNEGMSKTCVETAEALDKVIKNMGRSITEGSNYFKLLVDVFAPPLRSPKNGHLRNFYLMVPALTVNFCERMITAKERMSKKSKEGASFTDDGFAMGLAYLLKVLNQNAEFDSLHWFKAVIGKYSAELAELEEQRKAVSRDDEKLEQTLNLTSTRLQICLKEFTLLYYSLNSARVLFQNEVVSPPKEKTAASDQPKSDK